jgi:hypothetical protein
MFIYYVEHLYVHIMFKKYQEHIKIMLILMTKNSFNLIFFLNTYFIFVVLEIKNIIVIFHIYLRLEIAPITPYFLSSKLRQ